VSLASDLFAGFMAYSRAEDAVASVLSEAYGEGGWSDFTHDYYDESIEVYGCTPSGAAYDRLIAIGFTRIWQHPHEDGDPARHLCGCPLTRPPS
jgi:hypothetical protein